MKLNPRQFKEIEKKPIELNSKKLTGILRNSTKFKWTELRECDTLPCVRSI